MLSDIMRQQYGASPNVAQCSCVDLHNIGAGSDQLLTEYPFIYSWCVNKSCDLQSSCVPACGLGQWPWPLLTTDWWTKITSESGIGFSNTTSIFREVKSCSVAKVYWHHKGTYCLHLQGRIVGQASHLLTRFTIQPWRWRHYIRLKIQ
jgi:hypothetical protein